MRKFLMILAFLFLAFGIASCTGAQNITVTFEENGGEAVEDIIISINSTSINLPTPVREGYTFDGWYLSDDFTQPFTIAALLTQTGSVTLYAKWSENVTQYTITFEVNGGSAVAAITQASGTTVTAPTDPTKSGFNFGGWYSDAALTTAYTFGTMPAENITLYAKWVEIVTTQTITFDSNGGSAVAALVANIGSAITAPTAPTKTGYTFAGWYSDQALATVYTFTTMPADALTLYAKWTINQYTITFDANGGTAVAQITQDFNTAVVAPTAPTKDGYTFAGWYSDQALATAYTFGTMPAQNITLYAKWTINQYTITFDANGGTAVVAITQDFNTAVVAPTAPTKDGYTFAGWYSDQALATAYTFGTMPAQNITLYAKWTINQYTITFDANGGTAVVAITQDFNTAVVTPTAPTKDGHTFAGWYSDIALTTAYTFATMPAQNITLYAKWDVITYTITFLNADGQSPLELPSGATITLPTPTKEGYEFHGWYEDEYFITEFTGTTMPAEDFSVYAKWLPAKYLVHYNTDGGTVIDDAWGIYTFEIPVPNNDPYKEDYMFVGWYLDVTLTTPYDDQMMPASEITLYAKYVADTATLSIAEVLQYQPGHVKVSGTIVYTFPTGQPGYYVSDGTGIIFVLAPADLPVGTMIEFEADFGLFEYTPQLTNQMNRNILTEGTPETLVFNEMPISTIVHADTDDMSMMGVPVILQGVITTEAGRFYLVEPGTGERVVINPKSIDMMSNPFIGHVGDTMSIQAIIHGYDSMMHEWHVVYEDAVPAEVITLTDQEKVDALLLFAQSMLDGETFNSYQVLELPVLDPVYGATLAFTTIGDNAAYFNPTTGEFLDTTVELSITIRLTVTLNAANGQVDMVITLAPVEVLTISEFLLLSDGSFGVVEGIVIFSMEDMGIMILADSTGALLPVETMDFANVGDLIIVQGHHYNMMGLTILGGYENTIVEVVSTDHPNPLVPIEANVEQYVSLDPMNSIYWGRYFEVTGQLLWDDMKHSYILTDGENTMPVFVFAPELYEMLGQFTGFELSLRGFALPNFDEDEGFLMFVFSGLIEDIVFNYTNQELADMVSLMLKEYLESESYIPGQTLDLPTEHPVLPVTVVYEVIVADQTKVIEGVIDPTITEATTITVTAVITVHDATATVSIILNVVPIDIMTISDFIQLTDQDMHYIQAVILYIDDETGMMIVADATGMIMSASNDPSLSVGDEVVLYGQLYFTEGMTLISNDPDEIVFQVIATNQDTPLIPLVFTTGELYNQDQTMYPWLVHVQILGTLRVHDTIEGPQYYLEDGFNTVPIFMITDIDSSQLSGNVDQEVRVTGIWMNTDETEGMRVLIFLDRPGDVGPMFTDAELATYLADKLEDMYFDRILRPGSTQLLPTDYPPFPVSIVYEVLGVHASLYDLTTGVISDTITEHTEIGIRATITVGVETAIAEFTFVIEPIVTSTVAEFLAGAENEQFTVRGIVVLTQFGDGPMMIADDTGLMFIVKALPVEIGDEIIVTGIVTIEEGIKLMWDYETTVLDEILSHGLPSPLVAESLTIAQLNAIDMTDTTNWGRYIETVGISEYEDYSFYPMLYMETDYSESIPYMPAYIFNTMMQIDQSQLYMYSGFRIIVRGFLFPTFDDEDPFAPDRMLMIPTEEDITIGYTTDQEKMDALIAMGEQQLENQIFRPGDDLQLPEEMPVIDATFVWAFVGDVSLTYDEVNDVFLDVTMQVVIQLEATVTIGSLTQTVIFDLTVAPYPLIMIEDFYGLQENQFGKLEVIVARELNYGEYILQEPSSLLYLRAINFYDLVIGDRIVIFGQKTDNMGFISIDGWDDRSYVQVMSSGLPDAFITTTGYLDERASHSNEIMNLMYYYEVDGHLYYDSYTGDFYLTDGVNTMALFMENLDIYTIVESFIDQNVRIRFMTYEYWWTNQGDLWTGYVLDEPNAIQGVTYTDAEIADFMKLYAMNVLDLKYKDGLSYVLPLVNPYFGGTYSYQVATGYETLASISGDEITFTENANEYAIVVDITVTYGLVEITVPYEMTVYPYDSYVPLFVPGSEGALPLVTGVPPVGEFAGLYIYRIDRATNWGGGDDMVVDLYLPDPYQVGAEYYMLQYYDDLTSAWITMEDGYGPIQSYWDNFSIVLNGSMLLRAITDTGAVSNTVDVEYTEIDTYFTGYGLDMGMWITGVMMPFVGYGLELDEVGIFELYTNDQVFGAYTVQWYRVNPYTFDEVAIPGANSHTYITTPEDIGYFLIVEVKADEVNAGGMMRILVDETTKIFNESFINNVTNTGFDIGFSYEMSLSDIELMMMIFDARGNQLIPNAITATSTPFVYHVDLDLAGHQNFSISIQNNEMIAGVQDEFHMMPGFYIEIFEW
ncbi:MAG: InlB B-repeat-containing protein [Acholeplasmataceae bacterium]|jgi:uncharacterized repeat protein (TIGR02543 family)|nr:InlB B-repeat-containing protein [Acholeplasmataceae bacterium]